MVTQPCRGWRTSLWKALDSGRALLTSWWGSAGLSGLASFLPQGHAVSRRAPGLCAYGGQGASDPRVSTPYLLGVPARQRCRGTVVRVLEWLTTGVTVCRVL